MNMKKNITKRLSCFLVSLALLLSLLQEGQAWRLSHLSRKIAISLSPEPRVLHQWPRQCQQQRQQQQQTTDKDGAMSLKIRPFTHPRGDSSATMTTIANHLSCVMKFVRVSKDQLRQTLPFLATTLLWMTLVASRFSNHLVDVTTSMTTTAPTTTNHRPVVATVLPRRTTLQHRRNAQPTKNKSSRLSKPLTVVATLTGAVVGGTLLGRKLGERSENTSKTKDETDMKGNLDESISKAGTIVEEDQPDETSTTTPISNNDSDRNQSLKEQENDSHSSPSGAGQEQARQMVQRILDQYKDEQTGDTTKPPPTAAAGNTAVAVANPAGSPFLPLSTQTLDLKKQWDEQDDELPSQPVSFMDAINAMTPSPTSTNTQTPPLPNSFNTNPRAQPKSPQEELALQARYAAITDLSERAYQILLDLGMLDDDNTVVRYR